MTKTTNRSRMTVTHNDARILIARIKIRRERTFGRRHMGCNSSVHVPSRIRRRSSHRVHSCVDIRICIVSWGRKRSCIGLLRRGRPWHAMEQMGSNWWGRRSLPGRSWVRARWRCVIWLWHPLPVTRWCRSLVRLRMRRSLLVSCVPVVSTPAPVTFVLATGFVASLSTVGCSRSRR